MPSLVWVLWVVGAGCARSTPFVADNLYDEGPPRAPLGESSDDVFAHPPWELRGPRTASVRYLPEARLALPDSAESFVLGDVFVYARDGSDVRLEYRSSLPGAPPASRVAIAVSVYRARGGLEDEWRSFWRRWHEKQAGTLTDPLPLPDGYPTDTKRMAWILPVGDGYGGPVFQEVVLVRRGGWSIRYSIDCAAGMRNVAANRIVAFLGWIERQSAGVDAPPQQAGAHDPAEGAVPADSGSSAGDESEDRL